MSTGWSIESHVTLKLDEYNVGYDVPFGRPCLSFRHKTFPFPFNVENFNLRLLNLLGWNSQELLTTIRTPWPLCHNFSTVTFTDLDLCQVVDYLKSILTTLEASFIIWGSWGSSKILLELIIKPPLSNLDCLNRWNTMYKYANPLNKKFYSKYFKYFTPFTVMEVSPRCVGFPNKIVVSSS